MESLRFDQFALNSAILRAVAAEGYTEPTAIQRQAIPALLEGRDLLGTAQTGAGKTAAFALPTLHRLFTNRPKGVRHVRALVLTPTRELAVQIDQSFRTYGQGLGLRNAVVLGGVGIVPQIRALRAGVDILVATPGRLLDLMNQRCVDLSHVETLILDEADRMLDMGFIHDVRRIVAECPDKRQTLLFSATMPGEIVRLSEELLHDAVRLEVAKAPSSAPKIDERLFFVEDADKFELLADFLKGASARRTLIFTRTKRRADRIMQRLNTQGTCAEAIHSDRSQAQRQRALNAFDAGKVAVLVATDIVARGIDVAGISHVVNFDLPEDAESYIHRIGRTGRAGAEGTALTFCSAEEVWMLKLIEKLTQKPLTAVSDHPFFAASIARMHKTPEGTILPRRPAPGRPRAGDAKRNAPHAREGHGGFGGRAGGKQGHGQDRRFARKPGR